MATTPWQVISDRAADRLGIPRQEMREYVKEYSKLLVTNIKKFKYIQYEFYGVGKLTWKTSRLNQYLKKVINKEEKHENAEKVVKESFRTKFHTFLKKKENDSKIIFE